MALKLTHQVIKQAYDLLCATEPFSKWNLPDSDEVHFIVARGSSCFGWHEKKRNGQHRLAVSAGLVGQLNTLLETVAHEMIHLHMEHSRIKDTSQHGPAFQSFVAQVCKVHTNFDAKCF